MSQLSPLYKIPLLFWSSVCVHISFTPPNPPPSHSEQKKLDPKTSDVRPALWGMAPQIKEYGSHLFNLLESTSILATEMYPSLAEMAHPVILNMPGSMRITPTFAVSIAGMTAALLMRVACYRELGRHFTFELSIKKDHKLVTSGPYAFVRHPSYTACILLMAASLIAQLGRGSWWYEGGYWMSVYGVGIAALWVWAHLTTAMFFVRRTAQEDRMLRNQFGAEWDEWNKRTPYKLCPYLRLSKLELGIWAQHFLGTLQYLRPGNNMEWQGSSPAGVSLSDVFIAYITASLLAHYVFKRWEPSNVSVMAALLLVPPMPLALFLRPHVMSLTYAVELSYCMFISALVASIIAYRLSPFHPLARYPGPLMCKVTQWWMVWETRGGVQHLWFQRLHQTYGDATKLSLGPNELSFRDASIMTALMGTTGLTGVPRGPGMSIFDLSAAGMYPQVPSLIMHRDPVEHARRRKPWNRAFNTAALKEYQPIIASRVSELVERLAGQKGVIDFSLWISWFAWDFMGDLAFGGGGTMMQNGDGDDLWLMLKSGFAISTALEQVPWLPHVLNAIPALRRQAARMWEMGTRRAVARFEEGSSIKDVFYYLSNEDGAEKENPPKPIVVSDGFLVLVGGSDTTANALSVIFWGLLSQPDTYKRLREEVDKFFPPGEDSTSTQYHPKMVFLEAVINEALRLFPPIASGSQRASPIGGGDIVAGKYHIPEGTCVRLHTWSMHRDPRNFSRPETFWPARWLIADGLEETKGEFVHKPEAFIPFSSGPANCVGKQLAMQEMRIVVCHIVQKLDMRLADGWDPVQYAKAYRDYTIAVVGRLPVHVQLRM
ncbi:cytochrome P450 [Cytidiella melzeri]|nr:cytochrome P450 [Cytidiella melzeri]